MVQRRGVIEEVTAVDESAHIYTLDGIGLHATNIRSNAWDINSSLRGVLVHLRGEELAGKGVVGESLIFEGKIAAISDIQQETRSAQEQTFRLIAELQGLLNVNA